MMVGSYQLTNEQLKRLTEGEPITILVYPPDEKIRIRDIKRLWHEMGAEMRTAELILDDYSYDDAKKMIFDLQEEIEKRGPGGWTDDELVSLPVWKRDIIGYYK